MTATIAPDELKKLEQRVRSAANITLFIALVNIALGLFELSQATYYFMEGAGATTEPVVLIDILIGATLLLLSFFVRQRSALALWVAIIIYAIAGVGLLVTLVASGGTLGPGVLGGFGLRIIFLVALLRGVGAMEKLRQHSSESAAAAAESRVQRAATLTLVLGILLALYQLLAFAWGQVGPGLDFGSSDAVRQGIPSTLFHLIRLPIAGYIRSLLSSLLHPGSAVFTVFTVIVGIGLIALSVFMRRKVRWAIWAAAAIYAAQTVSILYFMSRSGQWQYFNTFSWPEGPVYLVGELVWHLVLLLPFVGAIRAISLLERPGESPVPGVTAPVVETSAAGDGGE